MKRSCLAALTLSLLVVATGAPRKVRAGDDGEAVFNQNCQLCHTPERVRVKHLTREEWQQIIEKMIGFGCPIRSSKRNQRLVLDYLVRTQGPGS